MDGFAVMVYAPFVLFFILVPKFRVHTAVVAAGVGIYANRDKFFKK